MKNIYYFSLINAHRIKLIFNEYLTNIYSIIEGIALDIREIEKLIRR